MKYKNPSTEHTVTFSVKNKKYTAAPGETIEVEPEHVPFVKSRGIKLQVVKEAGASTPTAKGKGGQKAATNPDGSPAGGDKEPPKDPPKDPPPGSPGPNLPPARS